MADLRIRRSLKPGEAEFFKRNPGTPVLTVGDEIVVNPRGKVPMKDLEQHLKAQAQAKTPAQPAPKPAAPSDAQQYAAAWDEAS